MESEKQNIIQLRASIMDLNEKELIANLKSDGNKEKAFQVLVKTYQERLYWHIRKIVMNHDDTDDILQNVYIKVWKNVDGFREDSSLFTWLFRIATNESLSHLQKQRRHSIVSMNEISDYLTDSLESDVYFDGDEIQKKLQLAIIQLPEKQRIVFNMKYFDEIKYEEMSEILQTSVGALKASFHFAVKKIEEFLKEERK
ncbi:MAG: sigma-70 family RNA polymerase sigma factor [Bacteroidia bacterium]|nr:sigma-70 family RNA polymerase sigma factor [Bacteroidia bacterium]